MLAELHQEYSERFEEILLGSIQAISRKYFMVERYDARTAHRERVYCYELYHQMRLRIGDDYPYTLHGEIDKRGHQFIEHIFGQSPNPDFVVHMPGSMNNLAVIEVKVSNCTPRQAQEDIEKIRKFCSLVGYTIGFFLLFGSSSPHEEIIELGLQNQNPCLRIYWHNQVNERPQRLYPR